MFGLSCPCCDFSIDLSFSKLAPVVDKSKARYSGLPG